MYSELNSRPTSKSPEMAYLSPFIYKKEIVSFSELQNLARKRSKGEGGEKEKGKKERKERRGKQRG